MRGSDFGIRVEVEEFRGHFNPYEFLNWLDNFEHFFEQKELPKEKVKFAHLS